MEEAAYWRSGCDCQQHNKSLKDGGDCLTTLHLYHLHRKSRSLASMKDLTRYLKTPVSVHHPMCLHSRELQRFTRQAPCVNSRRNNSLAPEYLLLNVKQQFKGDQVTHWNLILKLWVSENFFALSPPTIGISVWIFNPSSLYVWKDLRLQDLPLHFC